ncbi:MAG: rhomboid family intramembrane serine protease [Actinomycetota bacterium]|jgi:membrane associated rhomboid family serine protease|nr:rhomboid family intramembrane serine protease [Actinomycetota bacterium]
MIPIKDQNPTSGFAWVTLMLLVANVSVFAYEASLSAPALNDLIATWTFVPSRFLADPFSPLQWATLFAAMFMHGGWLHLGSNMLYLWIFGNNIEDRLGAVRFVAFYLLAGVIATAAQTIADTSSNVPMLGASGAIAGVLGAYLVLYPRAKVLTVIPIFFFIELAALPAVFVIGFWFLTQLVQGVASISPLAAEGGVAWFAHIGGFATGVAVALPFSISDGMKKRKKRFSATWK